MHLAKETDEQKRKGLAEVINVDPDRLVSLSGKTCTRIANAFRQCSVYFKTEGLSWRTLLRTPNIGYRSATALCDALGIPKNLHAVPNLPEPRVHQEVVEITKGLSFLLRGNPITPEYYAILTNGDSPCFVVEDRDGDRYRVTVEAIR